MNKSQRQLQASVVECLEAKLSGLREKHAQKLHRMMSKAARKLARKYAKLQAKELKGQKRSKPAATPPAPKKGALRASKTMSRASRHAPATRGGKKKTTPAKAAVEA